MFSPHVLLRRRLCSDTLNDLSYLDAVVRESLRVCPPVSITTRQAEADDVLPLSIPVRNIQTGEMIDAIPVKKGAVFIVPVSIINSSEQTWGPDATVFKSVHPWFSVLLRMAKSELISICLLRPHMKSRSMAQAAAGDDSGDGAVLVASGDFPRWASVRG